MTELTMPDLLKDDKERGKFFVNANNIAKSKNVPANQAHTWIHNELGITTLKDWKGTPAEALKILSDAPEWKPEDVTDAESPSSVPLGSDGKPSGDLNDWFPPAEPAPQDTPKAESKPAAEAAKPVPSEAEINRVRLDAGNLYKPEGSGVSDEQVKAWFKEDTGFASAVQALVELGHEETIRRVKAGIAKRIAPQEQQKETRTTHVSSGVTTITGIDVVDIPSVMNERYAPEAYSPIPYGAMAGKTDLGFEHARKRMDDVFGVHGFGWKLEPHPALGKVIVKVTHKIGKPKREGEKGREYDEYNVVMEMWVFKYRVRLPDGSFDWVEASPMSDEDSNEEQGYAYRGAFTSLLKQALRSLGGMDHILMGQYTHEHAARDKNRKAA